MVFRRAPIDLLHNCYGRPGPFRSPSPSSTVPYCAEIPGETFICPPGTRTSLSPEGVVLWGSGLIFVALAVPLG
eukprot:178782-Pyramimonas_sp.AAC.1